tara:strand:- start:20773 stop:21834 length:1062 start_codon:yes stop_codon:yes gene_type:complete
MKISIGTNIKDGPWGGGNLFAINLKNYLIKNNHTVVHTLDDNDIDLILLTEPRRTSESSMFTHIDILKYRQFVNNNVMVVHRINECDERKNTNFVNQYLLEANKAADATVFVSSWLRDLFTNQGLQCKNICVIMSGANQNIFYNSKSESLEKSNKLRIVTHHWGANWNKGFDVYKKLDDLLVTQEFKNKFSFTYIGNLPTKFKFNNSKHIMPLSGEDLANELRKNDVYLTASINEPSGNHHIEGVQCGLPVLYINSGGIPEYCDGYGIMFNNNNFEINLNKMYEEYQFFRKKVVSYKHNADKMSQEYLNLFTQLINDRDQIIKERKTPNILNLFEKLIYTTSRKIKYSLKKYR